MRGPASGAATSAASRRARRGPPGRLTFATKRGLDILVSAVSLIGLSPAGLVLALLVRIYMGSPVLFRQERPGRGGRSFRLLKFRTMTSERDAAGNLAPDEVRLTRFGKFLRSTSLDELPELWNVLRGEMSLVGPRPLLSQYLSLYSAEQARRHEVRPGITGWAQVNGRNELRWPERLAMDVWYVDNVSISLDTYILFQTLAVVFRRQGISQSGHATAEPFRGETR